MHQTYTTVSDVNPWALVEVDQLLPPARKPRFWHKSKMLCERVRTWNWTDARTLALQTLKEVG